MGKDRPTAREGEPANLKKGRTRRREGKRYDDQKRYPGEGPRKTDSKLE